MFSIRNQGDYRNQYLPARYTLIFVSFLLSVINYHFYIFYIVEFSTIQAFNQFLWLYCVTISWLLFFRSLYCSADTPYLNLSSWFLKQLSPDSEPGTHFQIHLPLFLRHPICVTFLCISNPQVRFAY